MNSFKLDDMFNKKTLATKSKNIQVKKINVNEIIENDGNFYPVYNKTEETDHEMVALVKNIEEHGLITPITLFQQKDNTYRIISGHRRFKAFTTLGKKTISAIIQSSNGVDTDSEQLKVISANLQREKTPEIIEMEVEKLSEIFDKRKLDGKIEEGLLKRDWIGQQIGRSGRTVQKYLTPELKQERSKEVKIKTTKEICKKINKDMLNFLLKDLINLNEQIGDFDEEELEKLKITLNDIKNTTDQYLKNNFS